MIAVGKLCCYHSDNMQLLWSKEHSINEYVAQTMGFAACQKASLVVVVNSQQGVEIGKVVVVAAGGCLYATFYLKFSGF